MKKKVLILNHVFWPDQINTARHISELSEELVKREWDVHALITNRSYVNVDKTFKPKKGEWKGVTYNRLYIPKLNQKKNLPRLITSIWIIFNWIIRAPSFSKFDALIIGTNPPFGYLALPFIRFFNKNLKILMWGFDLYPEAIYVSSKKKLNLFRAVFKPVIKLCYSKLDVIVDIGFCMRERYSSYLKSVKFVTLTPWSFVEPEKISVPHLKTRSELFNNSKLTLLYTGTMGNAHEYDLFIKLARVLRKSNSSVSFCFAGFGSRLDELKRKVSSKDLNISFAGFVETDEELEWRLSAADIILISLKDEWTGISVPSKFFSALAMGKAVLFYGSKKSSLNMWTKKFNLGFHLSELNIDEIAELLTKTSESKSSIEEMKLNSFNSYKSFFSKEVICNGWSDLLHDTIG